VTIENEKIKVTATDAKETTKSRLESYYNEVRYYAFIGAVFYCVIIPLIEKLEHNRAPSSFDGFPDGIVGGVIRSIIGGVVGGLLGLLCTWVKRLK
jgi:hypothetical protein